MPRRLTVGVPVAIIGLLSGLSSGVPTRASAQGTLEKPTMAEIRRLEAHITMPRGAHRLHRYVRYYYSLLRAERRVIAGLYVEQSWVRQDPLPASGIVVVNAEAEIPAPHDAECDVIVIQFDPVGPSKPDASCSSGLTTQP